ASTGIGTGPISLQTQVGTLGADNTTGNIVITNGVTTPVTLNIAGTDGVQVTGASGVIVLNNLGTINILTDGKTIRGPATIVVQMFGSTADINTGGQSSLPSIQGLGSGLVELAAGRDINLGDNTGFGSVRSASGSIQLIAERDISVNANAAVAVLAGTGTLTATAGALGGSGNITMATAPGALANAPQFATAGGDITLTTGAGGTMALASTGTDAVSSSGGNITLLADNLAIGSGVNAGTGTVTIAPVTTARPIDVGTSTGAGHLVVDATALSADLTADTLVIGANNAGSLTVNGALGPTNVSNLLKLDSGSNINLAATIDMAGRTLQLIAGAGISETPPVIASTLSITAVGPVSMLDANQIGTLAANVTGA